MRVRSRNSEPTSLLMRLSIRSSFSASVSSGSPAGPRVGPRVGAAAEDIAYRALSRRECAVILLSAEPSSASLPATRRLATPAASSVRGSGQHLDVVQLCAHLVGEQFELSGYHLRDLFRRDHRCRHVVTGIFDDLFEAQLLQGASHQIRVDAVVGLQVLLLLHRECRWASIAELHGQGHEVAE